MSNYVQSHELTNTGCGSFALSDVTGMDSIVMFQRWLSSSLALDPNFPKSEGGLDPRFGSSHY